MINRNDLERDLLECRRLITRAVMDQPEFSTMEKIRADYLEFLRRCDAIHKEAQIILVRNILAIEAELEELKGQPATRENSSLISRLKYWKLLLELFFNTFVWIALRLDRNDVKRIVKGPKYGALKYQNIDETLAWVDEQNKNPDVRAIPLDFCSFGCVCDVLRIAREPNKAVTHDLIEMKSGSVNDVIYETIREGTEEAYFRFFDQYGDKGIKQMHRIFKQQDALRRNTELLGAGRGIYENPSSPETQLIIAEDDKPREYYSETVLRLLEAADKGDFAVDAIDDCFVVGVVNTDDKNRYLLGEFDLKLFIHGIYVEPHLKNTLTPDELIANFEQIKLREWREGFGSVLLFPLPERRLPDKLMMDLLFGRKVLKFFFNPYVFVGLAQRSGINMKFLSKKATGRLKAQGGARDIVAFDGHAIAVVDEIGEWTLGPGTFDEIFYNWVKPISIIGSFRGVKYPDFDERATT
jgi:hypothetical protein